jgi:hypothetical protein
VINKPDLVPVISSPLVFDASLVSGLTLDGSQSYDPLGDNVTCSWDCPEDFGGLQCSADCLYFIDFGTLQNNLLGQKGANLSEYFDTSLEFTLNLQADSRTARQTVFAYIIYSPNETEPFNQSGIVDCSIRIFGEDSPSNLVRLISNTNVFYLDCI